MTLYLSINKKLIDITKHTNSLVVGLYIHAHIDIKRDENIVIITTE